MVFELLYGDDTQWMENFLTETKNKEVEVSGWSENKRTLVYIKPINAPIGPKQTKCTVTEEIEHKDFDKYVSVVATVSTPDVPNGTYFNPKTRTCLMHAGDGKTRMIVTCGITWHKSSWFKGQIERSTLDGSIEAAKDTENAIKRHLVDNPTNITATKSSETKKRKKVKKSSPKSSKHEKHESAHKNAAQVSAETQPTSKPLIDLNSLTSSTVIVLSIMAILLISNIISWYQIHTITQQIRSAGISKLHEIPTPQIPKLAISDPESEVSTVDFSDPESSSKTSAPSLQSIGTQLQFVGELLGNIDSEVKRMVTLNEQKNSMV
ncbi:hypothetical protein K7432_017082 [Basidiobolus ranarum]|uniref:VASt domain-containing protein n=1 Tax=Basidiobolus ranarum TaxID=34480 RepID=A0ABR2VLK7_9FUNG